MYVFQTSFYHSRLGQTPYTKLCVKVRGQASLPLLKGQRPPRPGQADLCPVSSSPCLDPVLVLLPFRIWRSTLSPPAGEQSLEKVQINSVPLGNICQQGEEALPGQGTLPRTPLIQWYLQLDTLPVDKVQPAITSLKCF